MYLLLVKHRSEIVYHNTYENGNDFHSEWYYWVNCKDSEGRLKYTITTWVSCDIRQIPV